MSRPSGSESARTTLGDRLLDRLEERLTTRLRTTSRAKLARSHPLRYLFLEVTRRCTLSCRYCGSGCSPAHTDDELSARDWVRVLQDIGADFTASDVMLAFTGGEPLLKAAVLDVMEEAAALGFPFGMVSNGMLITRDMASRLVSTGIGSISLSLDAPPALNDRLRGRGAASAVRRAVAHLQNAGYRGSLEIISTLTRPAVPHLGRLRHTIAEMGVRRWRLAPVIPIGRAAQLGDLMLRPEDLVTVLELVQRGRLDGLLPVPELGDECHLGEYEERVRPYPFACRAGITIAGIMANGRIGACPELGPSFAQGDIRSERLSSVWESRYQAFRNREWTRRGRCGACDAYDACQGGSLHVYHSFDDEPVRCLYDMIRAARPVRSRGGGLPTA